MSNRMKLTYVTSSRPKKEENRILVEQGKFEDGVAVSDLFEFEFRELQIREMLETDIRVMVQAEVATAYSHFKIPCLVEHAGLIFNDYLADGYPGGLTKPMWLTLGQRFVAETQSAGRRVTARAVVAYCDGMTIQTFVGETVGTIAPSPRGSRDFYWDTVFMPDDPAGSLGARTYSEIVQDAGMGLVHKVLNLSQSTKAMMKLLEHLRRVGPPQLWS